MATEKKSLNRTERMQVAELAAKIMASASGSSLMQWRLENIQNGVEAVYAALAKSILDEKVNTEE